MSKLAKIFFLIAFLLLVLTFAVDIMTGMWINLLYISSGAAIVCVVLALLVDYRMYWEFLTMRTTKHGMNMGAMILSVLVLLVCVNYLAALHNFSYDVTQEKLNSLSDQSTSVLKNLKDDVEIKVFTKGPQQNEERQKIKQALNLFQDYSNHVKIRYVNPYVDNDLAIQYLNDLPDRETNNSFVFVEHDGKRVRADAPFDEASITSALIKATRTGQAKVYFIKGHGEKDIDSEGEQGINAFVKSLKESSFAVESLSLIDRKEIPKDASAVAIVGPTVSYLDSELKWLRDYIENGGKLFIALDPGQHTNLAGLIKTLGVQFANNYVVTVSPIVGGGPAMVLGRTFDGGSEITKSMMNATSYALFYLTSEVMGASDHASSIKTVDIVHSDKTCFTLNDLRKPVGRPETRAVSLAVEASGKTEGSKSGKEFDAVIFGDSNFIANRSLMIGVNRDLGLNSFAKLAEQKDLLSIRPKVPKGTMLILSGVSRLLIVITSLSLPLILLVIAGVVWFRRRGA